MVLESLGALVYDKTRNRIVIAEKNSGRMLSLNRSDNVLSVLSGPHSELNFNGAPKDIVLDEVNNIAYVLGLYEMGITRVNLTSGVRDAFVTTEELLQGHDEDLLPSGRLSLLSIDEVGQRLILATASESRREQPSFVHLRSISLINGELIDLTFDSTQLTGCENCSRTNLSSIDVSPDGTTLVAVTSRGAMALIDLSSGVMATHEAINRVSHSEYSLSGNSAFFTIGEDSTINAVVEIDLNDWSEIRRISVPEKDRNLIYRIDQLSVFEEENTLVNYVSGIGPVFFTQTSMDSTGSVNTDWQNSGQGLSINEESVHIAEDPLNNKSYIIDSELNLSELDWLTGIKVSLARLNINPEDMERASRVQLVKQENMLLITGYSIHPIRVDLNDYSVQELFTDSEGLEHASQFIYNAIRNEFMFIAELSLLGGSTYKNMYSVPAEGGVPSLILWDFLDLNMANPGSGHLVLSPSSLPPLSMELVEFKALPKQLVAMHPNGQYLIFKGYSLTWVENPSILYMYNLESGEVSYLAGENTDIRYTRYSAAGLFLDSNTMVIKDGEQFFELAYPSGERAPLLSNPKGVGPSFRGTSTYDFGKRLIYNGGLGGIVTLIDIDSSDSVYIAN